MAENSNSGGGGDSGDKGGSAGLTPESIAAFTAGVDNLSGQIKELNNLAKARSTPQEPVQDDGDDDAPTGEEALGDVDLESLSRKELVSLIVNLTTEGVTKRVLDPLTQRLDGLELNMTAKEFGADIKSLAASNKDFWDFKEEMTSLSREHPTMKPLEVYKLAKALNPDKATELDKKYNPPQDDTAKRRPRFGGFAPNGNGRGATPNKAMSVGEALDDAWNQTMAKHGDILSRFAGDD